LYIHIWLMRNIELYVSMYQVDSVLQRKCCQNFQGFGDGYDNLRINIMFMYMEIL